MALKLFTIILCILSLLAQISESRITQETLATVFKTSKHSPSPTTDQGTNWAVLIAGSNGYGNYRHQADICHAYQILKRGGLKDENIVVFMYDDIANNEENPRKGIIINNPNGGDVYKGVPKDYTGESLTTSNLLAAILGDKKSIKGGSGKVVNSGPNDRIFIYYSDHGSPGVLTMPGEDDLYGKDFINTLKKKYELKTYKSMVIYVEACEAGSIFEGVLPNNLNIYVTTASNPKESSWATYCPGFKPSPPTEYDTCLGDLYSVAWMEDSDAHNPGSESLEQQYKVVLERTADDGEEHGSHVMQYGTMSLDQDYLSYYLGVSSSYPHKNQTHKGGHGHQQSISSFAVEQHEADILYLRQKVMKAEGPVKKAEAQKKLDDALSERKQVDTNFESIGKALFGAENGYEIMKTVRPSGQPIVDDWDCYKSMVATYKSYCGALSTYGKKHMRAFANVCNAGVQQEEMAKVTSQICANKNN
ncbi:vacuolar-processing enzyme-like [Silene latifolia]|uniref:vacuolar-processing enzyme-like n=1 Tax=Silene latifolia TaxID=37657 RepID=UPI003D787C10